MQSLLLTAALLAPVWTSDGLQRSALPADVDFVAHLDVEGLKTTELWKEFQTHLSAEGELDDLEEFQERYGIDPFTDVRAVTLYKMKSEEEPTVALFTTSTKIDEALKRLQKEDGYRRLSEGGIELHSWSESEISGHDTVYSYVHTRSRGERVVLIASNKESALRGARVLRGEEPSHAVGGAPLLIAPDPGSFLYVSAANIPHLSEFSPASQVFGLAQGIQVDLGEAGGFLRAHLALLTSLPEQARQISDVVRGLVSLGGLALTGEPTAEPVLELLRSLRISTRGNEVAVDFEYSVRELIEILRSVDSDDDDEADEADEADEEEHEQVEIRERKHVEKRDH